MLFVMVVQRGRLGRSGRGRLRVTKLPGLEQLLKLLRVRGELLAKLSVWFQLTGPPRPFGHAGQKLLIRLVGRRIDSSVTGLEEKW